MFKSYRDISQSSGKVKFTVPAPNRKKLGCISATLYSTETKLFKHNGHLDL